MFQEFDLPDVLFGLLLKQKVTEPNVTQLIAKCICNICIHSDTVKRIIRSHLNSLLKSLDLFDAFTTMSIVSNIVCFGSVNMTLMDQLLDKVDVYLEEKKEKLEVEDEVFFVEHFLKFMFLFSKKFDQLSLNSIFEKRRYWKFLDCKYVPKLSDDGFVAYVYIQNLKEKGN